MLCLLPLAVALQRMGLGEALESAYKQADELSAAQKTTCSHSQCSSKAPKLACSSCNAPYCSRQCQKAHWKQHKEQCKKTPLGGWTVRVAGQ